MPSNLQLGICTQEALVPIGQRMYYARKPDRIQDAPDGEDLFTYAPMFPECNRLAVYKADGPTSDDDCCKKYAKIVRGLTEGLLCMYCPHAICIAFTILTRHEGPSAAFNLILRRFDTGPALIIYDNVSPCWVDAR